jgi:hypothetical protein
MKKDFEIFHIDDCTSHNGPIRFTFKENGKIVQINPDAKTNIETEWDFVIEKTFSFIFNDKEKIKDYISYMEQFTDFDKPAKKQMFLKEYKNTLPEQEHILERIFLKYSYFLSDKELTGLMCSTALEQDIFWQFKFLTVLRLFEWTEVHPTCYSFIENFIIENEDDDELVDAGLKTLEALNDKKSYILLSGLKGKIKSEWLEEYRQKILEP